MILALGSVFDVAQTVGQVVQMRFDIMGASVDSVQVGESFDLTSSYRTSDPTWCLFGVCSTCF